MCQSTLFKLQQQSLNKVRYITALKNVVTFKDDDKSKYGWTSGNYNDN